MSGERGLREGENCYGADLANIQDR